MSAPSTPKPTKPISRASQQLYRVTAADLETALQYFELALQKDPNYAPAYAGIAMVWAGRQQMGLTSSSEAAPKAKAAALKAVELDDTIAEAHYALAGYQSLERLGLGWRRAGVQARHRAQSQLPRCASLLLAYF